MDRQESSPVFDNLDIDLLVKVLENTAFSMYFNGLILMAFTDEKHRSILSFLYSRILFLSGSKGYGSCRPLFLNLLYLGICLLYVFQFLITVTLVEVYD